MTIPITVLMSVYNGQHWLHESIESVLGQTHRDFEFIIVNDGSNDRSIDIIKEFATRDGRIRIIDKQNTGLADSLNMGIDLARGEWIARIDADDLCEPSRLAAQYDMTHSSKEFVLIGSGLIQIDEHGVCSKVFHYPPGHKQLVDRLIRLKGFFAHSSAFYHTQTARDLGGYRQRIKRAEDFDLWLRLAAVGEISCVEEPLVRIRHHTEQISNDEGGRRQLVDSRVALVSNFLRQKGLADPVAAESTEGEFAVFWEFVERGVDRDKLVEFKRFIDESKANLDMASLTSICAILALSARAPHFMFRYIREALFGERVAMRLVKEWINRGSTCAE